MNYILVKDVADANINEVEIVAISPSKEWLSEILLQVIVEEIGTDFEKEYFFNGEAYAYQGVLYQIVDLEEGSAFVAQSMMKYHNKAFGEDNE